MKVMFYADDDKTKLVKIETEYVFVQENKEFGNAEINFLGYSYLMDGSVVDESTDTDLLKRELYCVACPDLKTANSLIEQEAINGILDLRKFEVC